ncbi:type II toxin-antitoxin system RelE/ParE family toxin [Niabella aquatica]
MNYRLRIQEEAINDIEQAFVWYESQKLGLGYELIEEIENCYQQICGNPAYYGFVNKTFRRIHLDRFPYRLIYEVENDMVIINSFDHTKQDRNY